MLEKVDRLTLNFFSESFAYLVLGPPPTSLQGKLQAGAPGTPGLLLPLCFVPIFGQIFLLVKSRLGTDNEAGGLLL